ncbi:unnamed protein product, partial [Effrenium voratum]
MAGEPTTRQRHVRCAQAQSCRPLGDDELTVVIRPYIDEGGELQAAYDGGMGVVRLERPVDPDAEVTGTPMVDAGGETALHWAAMRCEDLVSCRRGRSRRRGGPRNRLAALHYAARRGHVEIARCLLKAGADKRRASPPYGHTPLAVARYHGNSDIEDLLKSDEAEGSEKAAKRPRRKRPVSEDE